MQAREHTPSSIAGINVSRREYAPIYLQGVNLPDPVTGEAWVYCRASEEIPLGAASLDLATLEFSKSSGTVAGRNTARFDAGQFGWIAVPGTTVGLPTVSNFSIDYNDYLNNGGSGGGLTAQQVQALDDDSRHWRSNTTRGVQPSASEHPEADDGDVDKVVLSDGTEEIWVHELGGWVLKLTREPRGTDHKFNAVGVTSDMTVTVSQIGASEETYGVSGVGPFTLTIEEGAADNAELTVSRMSGGDITVQAENFQATGETVAGNIPGAPATERSSYSLTTDGSVTFKKVGTDWGIVAESAATGGSAAVQSDWDQTNTGEDSYITGVGASGRVLGNAALPADARTHLATNPRVANRTELKALDTAKDLAALLLEGGREGYFKWDATVLIATHQADTAETIYVAPDAAADGAWVRVLTRPARPSWAGAVGDGTADDTSAIAALLTVASDIDLDHGTYRVRSQVTLPAGARFRNGTFVFDPSDAVTLYQKLFYLSGVEDTVGTALTADAAKDAITVSVADASGFSVGDQVRLVSSEVFGRADATTVGQWFTVRATTATTVTFSSSLRFAFSTANASKIYKDTIVTGPSFDNVTFKGPDNSLDTYGIQLNVTTGSRFKCCTFRGFEYAGCEVRKSTLLEFEETSFHDANGATGYGLSVVHGSAFVAMDNCSGGNVRHLLTASGAGSWTSHGVSAERSLVTGARASGFDAHPGVWGFTVAGVTVELAQSAADEDGIECRGIDFDCRNSVVRGLGGTRTGIWHGIQSKFSGHCHIEGNRVFSIGGGVDRGIYFHVDDTGGSPSSLIIRDNYVDGFYRSIYVLADYDDVENFVVHGNVVTGSRFSSLMLQTVAGRTISGGAVSGNRCANASSATSVAAIYFLGADTSSKITDVAVSGNATQYGQYGYREVNGDYNNITGHVGRDAGFSGVFGLGTNSHFDTNNIATT